MPRNARSGLTSETVRNNQDPRRPKIQRHHGVGMRAVGRWNGDGSGASFQGSILGPLDSICIGGCDILDRDVIPLNGFAPIFGFRLIRVLCDGQRVQAGYIRSIKNDASPVDPRKQIFLSFSLCLGFACYSILSEGQSNHSAHTFIMKAYLGLSLLTLLTRATSAQDTASTRAEIALHVLQDWYNPGSGIWDTCGWWNGANCMTVIGDLALVDDSEYVQETALEVFNNTYHVGPATNPYAFKPPPAATQTSSPTASSASATSGSAASPTTGYWGHGAKWVDGSFDDDAWWALAWITAFDNTQKPEYLEVAIDIYESLVTIPLYKENQ